MNPAVEKLVVRLPSGQREAAGRKVEEALAYGWTDIELVTPEGEKPHHYDLMGTHPGDRTRKCLPEA